MIKMQEVTVWKIKSSGKIHYKLNQLSESSLESIKLTKLARKQSKDTSQKEKEGNVSDPTGMNIITRQSYEQFYISKSKSWKKWVKFKGNTNENSSEYLNSLQ